MEVTKRLKPPAKRAAKYGGSTSVQAVTRVNAEQASKRTLRRLTHHCHIVETGNDSYRFKNSTINRKKEGKSSKTT